MRCAECSYKTVVTDSREEAGGASVKRRRKCLRCGLRVTTYEEVSRRSSIKLPSDSRKFLLKYGELSEPKRELIVKLVGYLKRN